MLGKKSDVHVMRNLYIQLCQVNTLFANLFFL
jgi:hypothetical protein